MTHQTKVALLAARHRLVILNQEIFKHPNFTDRHGDGDQNERVIALLNDALATEATAPNPERHS